jgi:hypothetical protein
VILLLSVDGFVIIDDDDDDIIGITLIMLMAHY